MNNSDAALQFASDDCLGKVIAVDTSKVMIDVSNSQLLTRLSIGNLLAIQGNTKQDYLIAITERVTRGYGGVALDEIPEDGDDLLFSSSPSDMVRAALIGTFRTVDGDKINTFKRGADSFPQVDRECFIIEAVNLQRFMGILGSEYSKNERLKIGTFLTDRKAEAIINGDKFFQRHAAILGSTGSGKSYTVALILERASKLKYPNIIVFDMHGEYSPLANKSIGGYARQFKIAGPGDLNNEDENVIFLPYWLLNRDEMLSIILDRSDQNAPNQASRFTLHVGDLKKSTLSNEGKEEVLKTFTVDSPIPYDINQLIQLLIHDDTEMVDSTARPSQKKQGQWTNKLTRFISRLETKINDRRYGFMFMPPTNAQSYTWLAKQIQLILTSSNGNGIKIIDFSEVPSDILPIVTGTFARLLYEVQFWLNPSKRTPINILCDEAHLYLPTRDDANSTQRQALMSFERIAKEGRKYGVSLLVVSQRPSDVSKTILSQCNNFLSLRLTNDADQSVIKRLMPESLAGLTDILPLLDTGEAILLGDAVLLPSRICIDKPSITPDSATRNFWKEWGTHASDDDAIMIAVEDFRRQTREP